MTKPAKLAAITLLARIMVSGEPGVDFVRKQIPTDEGHVSYEVRKRSGPPLILIPGSFNGSDQWKAVVEGLDRDLTIVLVEVRGHGQSWPPPANGSIEQFAQDVLRIADAEKIERFYVGGHSIGGMIALEIGRVSPRRVLGILSLEGWTHHQAQTNAFPNDNKYQRRPEHERQRLAERESGAGKWSEEQRKAFATIWRKWDGREFLASTSIPILELYGDRGLTRPVPESLLIPQRPNIRLQWISGVSHSMTIESPTEVAAAMTSFLKETEASRQAASHMFAVPGFDISVTPLDFSRLPRVDGQVVTIFRGVEHEAGFNMHPYITHFGGRFWAMWSSNRIRDLQAGQHIRYATSPDGIHWSRAQMIMGREDEPAMRYFARGFWVRDRELYALAAHDEAVRPLFGPGLKLLGYRWNEKQKTWDAPIVIADNTINNFPPKRLQTGEWMMSRRDYKNRVNILIGGDTAPDRWTNISIPEPLDGNLSEPMWWTLPDGRLTACFRDDAQSRRLYRSISSDSGRTWSPAVKTDFPDATAKFNVLRLRDGRYLMASNPNTTGVRIPMCLSLSEDGMVFRHMGVLRDAPTLYRYGGKSPGYAGYHYPQLLEHENSVYVIHAENMEDIKLVRIPMKSLPPAASKNRRG